ncbi:sensor histidine kinase [Pedobacter agri]|uniref:sensor histidine kinase n=1 Tax=Pedobacter agri TaxID=454586 RepID=UPI0029304D97|nr:sensor histidine kinase [Pedobacter agri]
MQHFKTPTFIIHLAGWLLFLSFPILFINHEQVSQNNLMLLASPYYWLFCLTYIIIFYFNALVLVPQLMFKKRYLLYILSVLLLFSFVYYAQPYDKLLGHNRNMMGVFGRPGEVLPNGLNKPPQMVDDTSAKPVLQIPFGPLPHEGLRMQDPNFGRNNPFIDFRRPIKIDIISLFLFFMIMGLSIATCTVQRWQNAESKVIKAEADKAIAELSFLKAQINPHFLFNTLNNIYTLSVINSEHTSESIMKLSNIMRYVTDDVVQDFVPLNDEINCIKDYIELQRLRLGSNSEINFHIVGSADGKQIGPLIFMTFIENAFKYGVSKIEKPVINIHLEIEDRKINFTCENKIYNNTTKLERAGIGIANTQRRLNHLYPDQFKLDIKQDNSSFLVELCLNC